LWCLLRRGAPFIDSSWQRIVDNIHRNASVKDKCIFTTWIKQFNYMLIIC
jgi:hypothetical protein